MALNVNELRNGTVFSEDGQLWQVLSYEHIKMGRGSGNVKLKVKNLKSGSITEKSFMTGARVDEANVERKKAQYLYCDSQGVIETIKEGSYQDGDSFNFMDPLSYEQFSLPISVLGDNAKFLLEGMEVTLIVSDEEAIGVELPNSIIYEIKETGPGEKGNTVSNVFKEATLENGLIVKVPMFLKNGDKVKVDTRTGLYVERVK